MFYLGGVALAFFLALLLFGKKGKSTADLILALWLIIVTLHLLSFYSIVQGHFPITLGAEMPLPLLHGPMLYIYTVALTRGRLPMPLSLIHFVPAVAVLVYMIPFIAMPLTERVTVYMNRGAGYETFNMIRHTAINLSGVLYLVLASLALRSHRKSIVEQFSTTDRINLRWLQYLIYWLAMIWMLVLFTNDAWVFGASVLFVVFIGYFGIRQVGIFHSPPTQNVPPSAAAAPLQGQETADPTPEGESRKYRKSGLSEERATHLHRQLVDTMSRERLFRESELSLSDLAERLGTQPNYLSQVINEKEGKSFYDYVNTLRIVEFTRLASDPAARKYTLLGLAQECGFTSKSSFNRYCRKVTGRPPSEFLRTLPAPSE